MQQEASTEALATLRAQGEDSRSRVVIAADSQRKEDVREDIDLLMQENEQGTTNTGFPSRNKTQKEQAFTAESDRSSLIQWSPIKLAGNKRTLDAVGEVDDTPGESEDERDDGEMNEEDELEGIDASCYLGPEDSSDIFNAQEPERSTA